MTPDLLALSRAVVALPGAPKPPQYARSYRADNGVAWVPTWAACPECDGTGYVDVPGTDSGESACFADCHRGQIEIAVLDLTDDATAGVMLSALPFAVKVVTRTEPRAYRLMWLEEDGEGLGPRQHSTQWCDSLGEAVARVMVARGRYA